MQTENFTMAADKKAGRPPARPEGEKPLTVRLPTDLYRLLRGVASSKGLSLNEAATEALSEWSDKYPALVAAIRDEIANEGEQSTPKKAAPKTAAKTATKAKK